MCRKKNCQKKSVTCSKTQHCIHFLHPSLYTSNFHVYIFFHAVAHSPLSFSICRLMCLSLCSLHQTLMSHHTLIFEIYAQCGQMPPFFTFLVFITLSCLPHPRSVTQFLLRFQTCTYK